MVVTLITASICVQRARLLRFVNVCNSGEHGQPQSVAQSSLFVDSVLIEGVPPKGLPWGGSYRPSPTQVQRVFFTGLFPSLLAATLSGAGEYGATAH